MFFSTDEIQVVLYTNICKLPTRLIISPCDAIIAANFHMLYEYIYFNCTRYEMKWQTNNPHAPPKNTKQG